MLYRQIERNKRKTFLLVCLFMLLVLAIGWAVGYLLSEDTASAWFGIVIAAVILAFYIPITYMTASAQILGMTGAKELKPNDNKMLYNIVEELAIAARLPMPKIYIVDDPAPNAFATGIKPDKAAVAFTTGLLERLNREELEGVAAHELAHIRNYDIRLMTVSIALVGAIALLADFGTRMMFSRGRGSKSNNKTHPIVIVIALAFIILAPLAARFVHFAVSRNREYLADATAVEFTRNAKGLKNALLKISQSPEKVAKANPATAALFISNPFRRDRGKRRVSLFATHPPIESRVEKLDQM